MFVVCSGGPSGAKVLDQCSVESIWARKSVKKREMVYEYYVDDSSIEQKKWSQDEIDDLKKNYGEELTQTIASRLNRTVASVASKAAYLGLAKSGRVAWSEEDLCFLKAHYLDMPVRQLAARLKRAPGVVRQKLYKMRLYRQ